MINRMIRAARLEVPLYEEVEHDLKATSQALMVVALVSVISGIGGLLTALIAGSGVVAAISGFIFGIIAALIFWAVWSFLIYWIGTSFFHGTATWGEVLRCLGFADSPGVLNFFRFIPVLGGIIALVVFVWLLITGIIAVRQSLDVTTGTAIVVAVIAWLIGIIISVIVLIPFGAVALL